MLRDIGSFVVTWNGCAAATFTTGIDGRAHLMRAYP
jgi:hypothetical protein